MKYKWERYVAGILADEGELPDDTFDPEYALEILVRDHLEWDGREELILYKDSQEVDRYCVAWFFDFLE